MSDNDSASPHLLRVYLENRARIEADHLESRVGWDPDDIEVQPISRKREPAPVGHA